MLFQSIHFTEIIRQMQQWTFLAKGDLQFHKLHILFLMLPIFFHFFDKLHHNVDSNCKKRIKAICFLHFSKSQNIFVWANSTHNLSNYTVITLTIWKTRMLIRSNFPMSKHYSSELLACFFCVDSFRNKPVILSNI